jgi:hypothetical protein
MKKNELIFYTTPSGETKIEVFFLDESFWLTQKGIAKLFNVKVPAVSKHLKNIFESKELDEIQVVSKMETTATFDMEIFKLLEAHENG